MDKNIVEKIEQSVNESWSNQKQSLMEDLKAVTGRIEDILELEIHRHEGHKSETLRKSFGSLGALTVNSESLASILGAPKESSALDGERLERIANIKDQLNEVRRNENTSFLLFHFDNNGAEIISAAENHLNDQAKIFRALRIARLEAKAKYRVDLHAAFFEKFNWSHLDDDELKLCSPVIVVLDMKKSFEKQFIDLLPLLSSGLPIKIFLIQDRISTRLLPESARAAISSSAINIELLPVALQRVFVFQSIFGNQHFDEVLSKGLRSPHPGFFSVYSAAETSMNCAVSSRSFPYFVYDPSSSNDFVSRLDLTGNPELESLWAKKELKFVNGSGEESTLHVEETFADYLLHEGIELSEFSTLVSEGKGVEHAVALSKYLKFSSSERLGKIPVVYRVKEDKSLEKLVPSRNVILQSAEKMDSWQALREMIGIENPHVQRTQKMLEEKLIAEKEAALASLRQELESKHKQRETQVVTSAMQNLSLRLFGMDGGTTLNAPVTAKDKGAVVTAKPVAETPVEVVAEPVDSEVSEFVWIESNLCTTCDECTTLNKNIFVYDDKKLAIVKDPKGGPFKDIVKAAELCPANIIHPGTPQDANEKNLDKLIKQAEPYQ